MYYFSTKCLIFFKLLQEKIRKKIIFRKTCIYIHLFVIKILKVSALLTKSEVREFLGNLHDLSRYMLYTRL